MERLIRAYVLAMHQHIFAIHFHTEMCQKLKQAGVQRTHETAVGLPGARKMLSPADPRGTATPMYRYRTIVPWRLSPLHRRPGGRHRDGEPIGQRARDGAADEGTDRPREAPWKHHAYQDCRRQAADRVEASAGCLAGVPRQEIDVCRYPWCCVFTGNS